VLRHVNLSMAARSWPVPFPRRADALFELADALLCTDSFPSLPRNRQ
jgi:hypothetical protein